MYKVKSFGNMNSLNDFLTMRNIKPISITTETKMYHNGLIYDVYSLFILLYEDTDEVKL